MKVTPFEKLFKKRSIGEDIEKAHLKEVGNSDEDLIEVDMTALDCLYKYQPVWKRMIFKSKVRKTLQHFKDEILLYGTSNNLRDLENNYKSNINSILQQKIDKQEAFRYADHAMQQEEKKWYILDVDRTLIKIWSIILMFIMFYTAIFMPYRMAFSEAVYWDVWTIIDLVIDIFFIIDIFINFFSSYHRDDGSVETRLSRIALHYLTTWFALDVASCIPFGLIDHISGEDTSDSNGRYNTMLRLIRLPRLYKLLKIVRVIKVLKHYKSSEFFEKLQDFLHMNSRLYKLFKFLMSIGLCVHMSGCFWYFAAKLENFGPETWVVRHGLADSPTSTVYLSSIYWAFTTITTVGYGDIHPRTELEIILAMIWMMAGVGFYSFTIGSLTSLMTETDTKESILNAKIAAVHDFSMETGISEESKKKMKQLIRYNCNRGDVIWKDRHMLFKELPKDLRFEVATSMYNGLAKEVSFFNDKDPAFVSEIMPYFRFVMFKDEEYVYKEGEYSDEVYIIVKGRINLVVADTHVVYKSYLRGSYFGESEIIHKIEYRHDSAQAWGNTEMLSIHRKEFLDVIEDFPNTLKSFHKVSLERMNRNKREKRDMMSLIIENQKIGKIDTILRPDSINMMEEDVKINEHKSEEIEEIVKNTQSGIKSVDERLKHIEAFIKEKLINS